MGFPTKSADVRIAQYELIGRKPKAAIVQKLADALDVSPVSLLTPIPCTEMEIMQLIPNTSMTKQYIINHTDIFHFVSFRQCSFILFFYFITCFFYCLGCDK